MAEGPIAWLAVLVPLAASLLLLTLRGAAAAWLNLGAPVLALALTLLLPGNQITPGAWLAPADLGIHLAILTALITACGSWPMPVHAAQRQALLGFLLLAVLAGDSFLRWAGFAAAGFAACTLPRLPRRLITLCAGALGIALFGTILQNRAAASSGLAFALLFVGYGGLAASLSPLSLTLPALPIALLAVILRAAHASAVVTAQPILLTAGCLALLLGALALWSVRTPRGFLAALALAQSGPVLVAAGVNAPLAGLLQLTISALLQAALIQALSPSKNLRPHDRPRAIALSACLLGLAGLPPFGLAASFYLMAAASFAAQLSWIALLPAAGLLACSAALLARIPPIWRQTAWPTASILPVIPAALALLLAILTGFAPPAPAAAWFTRVAAEIGP